MNLRACLLLAAVWLTAPTAVPVFAETPHAALQRTGIIVPAPSGFRGSCRRYDWLCSDLTGVAGGLGEAEILAVAESVNRAVNRGIVQVTDRDNYGVSDRWTLPSNGKGDCEDFVLLKYKRLLEAGVDGADLSVAIVLDRRGENHAVLVLRHASGDLVLDNLTSRMERWQRTGYRFLAIQSRRDNAVWETVARPSAGERPRAARLSRSSAATPPAAARLFPSR